MRWRKKEMTEMRRQGNKTGEAQTMKKRIKES